jgi:prepilin-type N-terminal cleavage/methylation domain-containing protein
MQTNIKKAKKGFTLIELMLAVAFLGTLLLSVAMLAMRLVDMYTKGATMRAVNSVGGAIVDDVRSHVTSSSLWSENLVDATSDSDLEPSQRQYYRYHKYTINPGTADEEKLVDYGAFCTNSYTYVFNYQAAMLRYRNGSTGEDDYIKVGPSEDASRPYALVRIKDTGCEKFKYLGMTEDEFNALRDEKKSGEYDTNAYLQKNAEGRFIKANKNDMTVLLDGSTSDEGTDLQIYDFAVMSATQSDVTNQVLYDIAFVLGTTRGGIDVKSSNNYCTKKSKIAENQDMANHGISYCSVNRFDFVVRQTGGE